MGVSFAVALSPGAAEAQAPERVYSGRDWTLAISSAAARLDNAGTVIDFDGDDARALTLERAWFRWRLQPVPAGVCRLRGLQRSDAPRIRADLAEITVAAHFAWADRFADLLRGGRDGERWIPHEHVEALLASRPVTVPSESRLTKRLGRPLTAIERTALHVTAEEVTEAVASTNDDIMRAELVKRRELFDRIERSPLTEQQAEAVVCFDSRVHVIAAAGSGKTSVMVARAAYAVERGFIAPGRILLLAFNRDAAVELQERADARFDVLGIDSKVTALTFHSFGLALIGSATGKKPHIAPWVENSREVKELADIVNQLCGQSPTFALRWELYRRSTSRTQISDNGDGQAPALVSLQGDVVRSFGELMITNWLYLNGINHVYEQPYVHDVATAEHAQYRPDFYYPDIEVWHEHWALDANGEPPASADFAGYGNGIDWKRQCHAQHGTELIETTWAQIIDGSGFGPLRERLEDYGLQFEWQPDRSATPTDTVKHEDLLGFVRTFLSHVKSNSLTPELLSERVERSPRRIDRDRATLFLGLFWEIFDEWQQRLRSANLVDFEDMLLLAAEHLEHGNVDPGYELIMVDEFQDASNVRARLVQALLSQPNRYLLAVGDDWQSINRFAGADISVMNHFEQRFGPSQTLRLETTFRSTQTICNAASAFISKNPKQLSKTVRSVHGDGPAITVIRTGVGQTADAIAAQLTELSRNAGAHNAPDGRRPTVKVLGRYRYDGQLMPSPIPPGLDVEFLTVHRSKGLEADHVFVPRMTNKMLGFPCRIVDDPLLDLAMAAPDPYPHAEERRLFYVALTRARRSVVLFTERGRISPFIDELVADGYASIIDDPNMAPPCPRCGDGNLVARNGKHGPFWGCSEYPDCRHTQNKPPG
jgi:DNA helicase IV